MVYEDPMPHLPQIPAPLFPIPALPIPPFIAPR